MELETEPERRTLFQSDARRGLQRPNDTNSCQCIHLQMRTGVILLEFSTGLRFFKKAIREDRQIEGNQTGSQGNDSRHQIHGSVGRKTHKPLDAGYHANLSTRDS